MLSSETKAALIGSIVGAVISGLISIWSVWQFEKIEKLSFQRNIEINRANHITNLSLEILDKYGNYVKVNSFTMEASEFHQMQAYINALEVVGAENSHKALQSFYKEVGEIRGDLTYNSPKTKQYYASLAKLSEAFNKDITNLYTK